MSNKIKNAELIRAVLDGKQVQYKDRTLGWLDYGDSERAISALLCWEKDEFRIKPDPWVLYLLPMSEEVPLTFTMERNLKRYVSNKGVSRYIKLEVDQTTLETTSSIILL